MEENGIARRVFSKLNIHRSVKEAIDGPGGAVAAGVPLAMEVGLVAMFKSGTIMRDFHLNVCVCVCMVSGINCQLAVISQDGATWRCPPGPQTLTEAAFFTL